MFADEIRRAVEASNRITLPAVAALLWRAYGDEQVSEAEAEMLSALIADRQASGSSRKAARSPGRQGPASLGDGAQDRQGRPRAGSGSRPRTDASMARRRRWAASGRLPPQVAMRFTVAEVAVLAVVASEHARRGDCRLAIEHTAALAGVSRTMVKATLRLARSLGLILIEERRSLGWRNDTNIVRIIDREWVAWMRLARRGDRPGGGGKFATPTDTVVSDQRRQRLAVPAQGAGEEEKAGRSAPVRRPPRFAMTADRKAGSYVLPASARSA